MGSSHTVKLHVRIRPNSGQPFYRQIADQVKTEFLRGYLQPGERLPSVRELAKELSMNPTTIVKAYDLLEHERLIVRRQGQGAFVADGNQPLHPDEREGLLAELAGKLAIEGRRLGYSEAEIEAAVRDELARLRPESKKGRAR